jgi:hypothetical protein
MSTSFTLDQAGDILKGLSPSIRARRVKVWRETGCVGAEVIAALGKVFQIGGEAAGGPPTATREPRVLPEENDWRSRVVIEPEGAVFSRRCWGCGE